MCFCVVGVDCFFVATKIHGTLIKRIQMKKNKIVCFKSLVVSLLQLSIDFARPLYLFWWYLLFMCC
jgi:hypothetical protein